VAREDVGGSEIGFYKSGEVMSIVDDTKKAVTDCFKRCAARFGLARDLYGEMVHDDSEDEDRRYGEIMARVQKAEEATKEFTDISKYRMKHLGHDALASLDAADLEGYYRQLRSDYKGLKKAHEERKEASGNDDPSVPEGFLEGIEKKEKQITKLSGKAITAIRKDVIKSTDLPDDMATLIAYDKIVDTLIEQAG
jgi:hypothetical protein